MEKTKLNEKDIKHIECQFCKRKLTYFVTYFDDDSEFEIKHENYFIIERRNSDYELDGNIVVEDISDSNIKMQIVICQCCFDKILNQSSILGNHFLSKDKKMFIY